MRVVEVPRYGGADVLTLAERDMPVPGPGQVLVRVRAAGVNPFDYKMREGWLSAFYPMQLPYIPGSDFAGEVVAQGAGVTDLVSGDRVYGQLAPAHGGTYCDYLAVDAGLVRRMPGNLSFVEAAAVPLAAITAWIALVDLAGVKPGARVLIHAGSGGVGGMAVQLAKHLGAWVASTCSEANRELVRDLGADLVLDYTRDDLRSSVGDLDAVIDLWGGDASGSNFAVLRPGGTLVVVLRNDPAEMAQRERLSAAHQVTVKVVMFETMPGALDALAPVLASGALRPNVQTVLPLADAASAQTLSQSRRARGKIVLDLST